MMWLAGPEWNVYSSSLLDSSMEALGSSPIGCDWGVFLNPSLMWERGAQSQAASCTTTQTWWVGSLESTLTDSM
jgi:hypothetical protein